MNASVEADLSPRDAKKIRVSCSLNQAQGPPVQLIFPFVQ